MGALLGPKRYPDQTATSSTPRVSTTSPPPASVPVSLMQVHHKKSTELEKMIYKEQFPNMWSTERVIPEYNALRQ